MFCFLGSLCLHCHLLPIVKVPHKTNAYTSVGLGTRCWFGAGTAKHSVDELAVAW